MGLDMYLEAKRYLSEYDEGEKKLSEKLTTLCETSFQVKAVSLEVMYWRKSNAIHKWFVDNCQDGIDDCRDGGVSRTQLGKLRDVCRKVLDVPELASELLPSQEGFFFGPMGYDERYYSDLGRTVEAIDKALILPSGWFFSYSSIW